MTSNPTQLICPQCRRRFLQDESRYPPFCCQRCKLLDLGHWFDGDYAIAGNDVSPQDLADPDEPSEF